MPLYTQEQRMKAIWLLADEALKRAKAAEEYAERSARMHHEAICRLNQLLTGSHRWPAGE